MDEQLRRRSVGAPAARSLLLTVLGEYVLPRGDAVWQETLVGALTALGYTSQAARQALVRSIRDGWLVTERRGRRARITLSEPIDELLRSGAERIELVSPWGGQIITSQLRCKSCGTYFEGVREEFDPDREQAATEAERWTSS